MDIKQNGSTKAEPFHLDKNLITEFSNIFQGYEKRVGILNGRKPDGKKINLLKTNGPKAQNKEL